MADTHPGECPECMENADELRARADKADLEADLALGDLELALRRVEQHSRRADMANERAERWKQRHDAQKAALSRVLADMEELGALVDGITDTDGGKWIPCADVLTLVAEHRDRT